MAEKQTTKAEPESQSVSIPDFLGIMGTAMTEAMKAGAREINPRRDNPDYTEDSAFKPKGVAKPELTRRYIIKGLEQEFNQLTPEECGLLNQLKPGDYTLIICNLPRTVEIREKADGSIPTLKVEFPLSIEERAYTPPLTRLLRAIISGAESADY